MLNYIQWLSWFRNKGDTVVSRNHLTTKQYISGILSISVKYAADIESLYTTVRPPQPEINRINTGKVLEALFFGKKKTWPRTSPKCPRDLWKFFGGIRFLQKQKKKIFPKGTWLAPLAMRAPWKTPRHFSRLSGLCWKPVPKEISWAILLPRDSGKWRLKKGNPPAKKSWWWLFGLLLGKVITMDNPKHIVVANHWRMEITLEKVTILHHGIQAFTFCLVCSIWEWPGSIWLSWCEA